MTSTKITETDGRWHSLNRTALSRYVCSELRATNPDGVSTEALRVGGSGGHAQNGTDGCERPNTGAAQLRAHRALGSASARRSGGASHEPRTALGRPSLPIRLGSVGQSDCHRGGNSQASPVDRWSLKSRDPAQTAKSSSRWSTDSARALRT